jgi:fatty-acyl-CoA synthase
MTEESLTDRIDGVTAGAAYVRSSRPFSPEPLSIGDLLRKMAAEAPRRKALLLLKDRDTGEQRSWDYAELLNVAEATARRLLEKFEPGEHVTLWSPNRPEWLFVQFGAALAGVVLVAVSPACTARELSYVLQQSNSAGIVYSRQMGAKEYGALLESVRPQCPALRETLALEDWLDLGAARDLGVAPTQAVPLPTVQPEQAAMIQYTSGTTGKPKAAMLSHYSLVNTAKTVDSAFEMERGSIWMNTVPLYSTSGCVFTTLAALWNRGTQLLLPRFDPELVFRGVEEEHANWIPLVPTMAVAVLDHPSRPSRNFSSVKVVVTGGSPVSPDLVKRVERDLGVDFVMVFGQTETSGAVCLSKRKDSLEHRTSTIGYPLGGVELRITDPDTNKTRSIGEIGEICIRGSPAMLGYYNMPEATAAAIDADGWLHTGDLGTLRPDGYPQITGRLKDMIIRGASNIYPRELEDILNEHPSIAESAVFGIPEPKYGEFVVAAIRLRKGATLDQDAVTAYLSERIARYKLPAHVWFVDAFPLTPSGKIQKFILRDEFLARAPGVAPAG